MTSQYIELDIGLYTFLFPEESSVVAKGNIWH